MAKRKQKRKHNDNATVRKASAVSNRKYKDTVFRMIHQNWNSLSRSTISTKDITKSF